MYKVRTRSLRATPIRRAKKSYAKPERYSALLDVLLADDNDTSLDAILHAAMQAKVQLEIEESTKRAERLLQAKYGG